MLGRDNTGDEKADVERVETSYEVALSDNDVHPEQDWTPEEERAVV
jgi:hypothetical protein|tara:strand:+ start:5092 stop:5229 length:138 start_codon:yes stop_codon:yes gene_type:complete